MQHHQPDVESLDLRLETPFRVAHGSSSVRHNVIVRIGDGYGEAAIVPYYPFSRDDVMSYLRTLPEAALPPTSGVFHLQDALDALPEGPAPARAAADMALHDHWARTLGLPLYRLFGLNPAACPVSSITVGIPESEDALRETARRRRGWPLIKLKVGSGELDRDEAIVAIVAEETGARICVDANGGWSVPDAASMIGRLERFDLAFVEQPISADDPADWIRLRAMLPSGHPPLIADESLQGVDDIIALRDSIDGINVKLAKAGGLAPAGALIGLARMLGLQVLLGCMVESGIAVSAAAHLAPLADFADLDGSLLLAANPFEGVVVDSQGITLPERPGLGVVDRAA
jgi:L-Ala-D/L-Glu epimerase